MKRKYICLIICLAFILSLCFTTQNIAMAQINDEEEKVYCVIDENTDFSDNTIMVVLTNKVSLSTKKYVVADFPEISCVEVTDLTEELWQKVITHQHTVDCNPELETKAETFHRILKITIADSGKSNVIDCIRKLEKRKDVKRANPNYVVSITASPNDTYYKKEYQWGVDKIDLPNAWDIDTGSSSVFVGVVDSGIDNTHPDLVNRVNTSLSKDFSDDLGQFDSNPFEDNVGHGTHVAGIIGAEGNNNIGIVGVCWNVSLVSLKVTNEGEGYYRDKVAEAIQYAELNSIPILNISLGLGPDDDMADAVENYSGLIVCSAGNSGVDIDNRYNYKYPACYPNDNVLTVGASTSDDKLASFSNYGLTNVDIFAPGESILSTYPLVFEDYLGYIYMSGTSMAAPFVTGVAALLLSHDSTLTANSIKETILNNYDEVDELSDKCVTGGRLNAYKALSNPHKHSYVKFSAVNNEKHTKTCDCGYTVTEKHNSINHYCADCEFTANTHVYSSSYVKYDGGLHWACCSCGDKMLAPHVIGKPDFDLFAVGKLFCILCKSAVDFGQSYSLSMDQVQYITPNGSFILPNGVIVLDDKDIVPYLNGSLKI